MRARRDIYIGQADEILSDAYRWRAVSLQPMTSLYFQIPLILLHRRAATPQLRAYARYLLL